MRMRWIAWSWCVVFACVVSAAESASRNVADRSGAHGRCVKMVCAT